MIFSATKFFYWDELISYLLSAMMLVVGNAPLGLGTVWNVFLHWMLIEAVGSFLYTSFAVNNGHHGPDIVCFTVLGYYGLHALHRLFPTLDHAVGMQSCRSFWTFLTTPARSSPWSPRQRR
jgi:hypothetical protein